MAPTAIHIEGRATITAVAEQAVLVIDVCDSGYDKATVSKNVVDTVNKLDDQFFELRHAPGHSTVTPDAPVSLYTISALSTRQEDEYEEEGKRTGKKLQIADSQIEIHFRDFPTLGKQVVRLSATPFVQLRSVSWKLTDEKQATLDEEARVTALRNAIQRANVYARVIGSETVKVVKIEDSHHFYPVRQMMQTARNETSGMGDAFEVGVGIDFQPQKIEVSATLQVEFSAE